MLDRGKRSLWSEGAGSAVRVPRREPHGADGDHAEGSDGVPATIAPDRRLPAIEPRVAIAFTLITAGVVWALVRGLEFYGFSPVDLVYDLDQPPLLLMVVAVWLLYRSRPR